MHTIDSKTLFQFNALSSLKYIQCSMKIHSESDNGYMFISWFVYSCIYVVKYVILSE